MSLLNLMFRHKRASSAPSQGAKSEASARGLTPVSIGKPPIYFHIILFLIPFVFFFFSELMLTLFSFGRSYEEFIEVVPGRLMLNPEIAMRYFYRNTTVPKPMEDLFYKEKPADSFRIFILGENCAAGYPYLPTSSFSRYLERRLKAEYPRTKIEVINMSIMAINSYALRDLMPGIIRQKPDLIIVYAGHNEYYGALGAASTLPIGRSRRLINLMLYMEKFKTVELMSEIAKGIFRFFRHDRQFGIVSSEVSSEQEIPYNSRLFRSGVMQFEGNLRDILTLARSSGVPLILGTLVCNLKDQPPFKSSSAEDLPSAEETFIKALGELKLNKTSKADSLFRLARDLDMLKFRAPGEMNLIIKSLAREFHFPVVKIDSVFDSLSPSGITGNDLMTDHLHPNLYGYQMMGELFFQKMKEHGIVPKTEPAIVFLKNEGRF